jgi:ABC-type oligopeptide transport system substrate-binding subunit
VRALYEGLTEYDPQTLAPVAGVAARWESSADKRAWTFYLRHDARWSDGAPVTAQDFVRSWRRSLHLGERAPHVSLLANIVGATRELPTLSRLTPQSTPTPAPSPAQQNGAQQSNNNTEAAQPHAAATPEQAPRQSAQTSAPVFGAEALDDYTLRVRLERPDDNFPALVAHTIFRPVRLTTEDVETERNAKPLRSNAAALSPPVISNGAFQLTQLTDERVSLERARNYWNAGQVALERVQFVNLGDTESALAAYHAGEVDAVTNVNVEPLAVKLLAPYKDFRRATFGALTYYAFNTARPPFDDLRVRQALSLAVDRARLNIDTLEGAAEPALKFMPEEGNSAADDQDKSAVHDKSTGTQLTYDPARARQLLAEAGYPSGAGFPRIRLLVNRNEQHRAVAQAIAAMWRSTLGVETEIVLKSWDEYEDALRVGDYDVARRSIVMQTTDEETNMLAMFAPPAPAENQAARSAQVETSPAPSASVSSETTSGGQGKTDVQATKMITSEREALEQLPAMPVYFASSYALVKPYVNGFDTNLLDAPSLQRVRIETNWQPPVAAKSAARLLP